jgi:mannosyltransferase OCH1-like enzyme
VIPKVIHRTVPKDTSARIESFWKSIRKLHPDWDLLTWREPLDPSDFPLTSGLWDRCESGAQKADIVRLELLVTHGGIYVDADVQGLRPFTSLLSSGAFAAWEDNTTIPNAVMGCEAGHPAFVEMLEVASGKLAAGAATWHIGPGTTTPVLKDRDDVLLLPPGSLYPYHYLEMRRKREQFRVTEPWAFCVHHWHGSWLSDDQRRSLEQRQR